MNLVFVLATLLSVLTTPPAALAYAQPITPAIPFGQSTQQQQPITAATPFEQLAQQQQQQPQQAQVEQQQQQQLHKQEQQSQQITSPNEPDMVLLSSRFNDDQFGGQIVGEIKNIGTEAAEFIEALATFRNVGGTVVDTAFTYADKQTITSGDTSPFNLFITSDVVKNEANTYDLTLIWRDEDTNQFAKNVLSKQPLIDGSGSSNGNGGGSGNGGHRKPCVIITGRSSPWT
jgi:hypothetical protein